MSLENDYPFVFLENADKSSKDAELFEKMLNSPETPQERRFFEEMRRKEWGEFAPNADLIINEDNNDDEIYLVRYYYEEYKLGRGKRGSGYPASYKDSLSDILGSDMSAYIGRGITLLDWLRENNFECVNYDGNYALSTHGKY